ncbi:MAG: arylsulfatase [Verrucomicrobiae bacterium]|nr:arylsulfatase [Verrucomicrobiae bacterium]
MLTFAMIGVPVPAQSAENPNIVIILVDDMGYGDPRCYNPESKIDMPNFDRIAREGMRFTDAHAPGALCHPSRYGLLTGRYPFRAPVEKWRTQPVIAEGEETIASLLRKQGYQTAMVGKWHLGFAENGYDQRLPGGPIDRGFDSFFGIRASTDIPPYFYIRGDRAVMPPTDTISANNTDGWSAIQGAFWREGGIAPDLKLEEVLPRFASEAVEVIRNRNQEKPLMLYLALPAPHTPWLPSPEFAGKSKAGLYGDFAMMVDAEIGKVLGALQDAGMADDTLLIITSDNGPVWYDADVARLGHDSSGGLRGMKADAWECGHRMPFLVRWPEQVKAGAVTDRTICFTDLMATIAAITGAKLEHAAGPDSFDFSNVLLGSQPEDDVRPPLVIPAGQGIFSIRSGDWKFINGLGSGGFSEPRRIDPQPGGATGQLYNLKQDLAESQNLFLSHPDIVSRLEAELQAIRNQGRTRPVTDLSQ